MPFNVFILMLFFLFLLLIFLNCTRHISLVECALFQNQYVHIKVKLYQRFEIDECMMLLLLLAACYSMLVLDLKKIVHWLIGSIHAEMLYCETDYKLLAHSSEPMMMNFLNRCVLIHARERLYANSICAHVFVSIWKTKKNHYINSMIITGIIMRIASFRIVITHQ